MAIANYSTYRSKLLAPYQRVRQELDSITVGTYPANGAYQGAQISQWLARAGADTPSAPSTAAAPDRATTGAMHQFDSSGTMRYAGAAIGMAGTTGDGATGTAILCDRLSHQGGLSGTAITPQVTNLPTAALTRYTTGDGVMMALEIYTAIGATPTTVSVVYTDQAGTPSLTSPSRNFGGSAPSGTATGNIASLFLNLPLAQGDTGVRAVASVLLAASTGTAGNFGVTLYKPLLSMPIGNAQAMNFDGVRDLGMNLPQIQSGACLWWIFGIGPPCSGNTFTKGLFSAVSYLVEE